MQHNVSNVMVDITACGCESGLFSVNTFVMRRSNSSLYPCFGSVTIIIVQMCVALKVL